MEALDDDVAPFLLLSDDLLRKTLLHTLRPARPERFALARVCRRFAAVVREAETLWASVVCGGWISSQHAGLGALSLRHDELTVDVHVDANASALSRFGTQLERALDLAHLAWRRSAARIGVHSLCMQRHAELSCVLPPVLFHIEGISLLRSPDSGPGCPPHLRASALQDLTLCHCLVPAKLGGILALTSVTCLRLYGCVVDDAPEGGESHGRRRKRRRRPQPPEEGGGSGAASALRTLADGLAALPLTTLVWVGERLASVPIELLSAARARPLERLVLSIDCLKLGDAPSEMVADVAPDGDLEDTCWDRLVGASARRDGGEASASAVGGSNLALRDLVLLGAPDDEAAPAGYPLDSLFSYTLQVAVLRFCQTCETLVRLYLEPGLFKEMFKGSRVHSLPPTLTSLGAVDCSWLDPTWFPKSLESAFGNPHLLPNLTHLYVYVNSPGATRTHPEPSAAAIPEAGVVELALGPGVQYNFEPGCALDAFLEPLGERLPSLAVLVIEWYEEDEICPRGLRGLGDALGRLRSCRSLEAVHLCRGSEACPPLVAAGPAGTAASAGAAEEQLRLALPGVRVCVHNEHPRGPSLKAEQYAELGPRWVLDDALHMLDDSCSRGLLPVSPDAADAPGHWEYHADC